MKGGFSNMFMRSILRDSSSSPGIEGADPPIEAASASSDSPSSGPYPLLEEFPRWSRLEQYGLEFVRRYQAVKVAENEDSVTVALGPEGDPGVLGGKLRRHHAPKAVHFRRAESADFRSALARLFSDVSVDGGMTPGGGGSPDTSSLDRITGDAPAVNLVNSIILDAVRLGASDIHVERDEVRMTVRYRLDGLLRIAGTYPPERFASVSSRIKLMANLNIMESRKPQDGRLTATLGGRDVHMRLSVVPLIRGESLVLRLFHREEDIIHPGRLGFPGETVEALRRLFRYPHGLILVTGPTGSGKSTTLSAFLAEIKDERKKIITLEDPVEYIIPGIDQIQVNEDIGLTFGTLLRRVLRQDPDVLMVGEIRDGETASLGIRAALTGHLVLATLHTNDAPSALTRLMDMGIPPYLLGAVLRGVLAQRLVRTLCPRCRETAPLQSAEAALCRSFGAEVRECGVPGGGAAGCGECAGGYAGRTAVSEWFAPDEELSEIIAAGDARRGEIRGLLEKRGFRSLVHDAFEKAAAGITAVDEIRRAVVG